MKHSTTSLVFCTIALMLISGCGTVFETRIDDTALEPFERNSKFLVGVLPISNGTDVISDSSLVDPLSSELIEEIDNQGRYRVVERQRIDEIFNEAKLQLSGAVDASSQKKVGQLLGVDALCIAEITSASFLEKKTTMGIAWVNKQTARVTMSARLVDVEAGEVLATAEMVAESGRRHWVALGFMKLGSTEDQNVLMAEALSYGVEGIAYKLSQGAPKK